MPGHSTPMNSHPRHLADSPAPHWQHDVSRRAGAALTLFAATMAFAMLVVGTVAPSSTVSASERYQAELDATAQKFSVSAAVVTTALTRDDYSVTPGIGTWVRGGTNHDWAHLVLLFGGWPQSDNNVTVITRWMRQENGANNWWNRNNPLNNGWGSGGGSGTGSYPDLVTAARYAAVALKGLAGYAPIVTALSTSAPTATTESAIWWSPWAGSHYANGTHWHYTPVDVVKAPAGAWG